MYQLKEQKLAGNTEIETDRFGRLSFGGEQFISHYYSPMDADYQIAAISVDKAVGMNVADRCRPQLDDSQIAKSCYAFSMRHRMMGHMDNITSKDFQEMCEYGMGYIESMSEFTKESPIAVLSQHLNDIDEHYAAEHGAAPETVPQLREAVAGYYKDVLNFGKPAYMIQAQMDAASKAGAEKQMDEGRDFADAVASIPESGQQMEQ